MTSSRLGSSNKCIKISESCVVMIFFRKETLQFGHDSCAVANRYNNAFVLRHFSPVYESLPSSIVSILKPLLADNSCDK